MEALKPVEISEYYIDRVSAGMRKYFWENIFAQIFETLSNDNVIINSKADLLNAIKNGKVYYLNGAFRGKFNNKISQTLEDIGARYRNGAYYIERQLIPVEYMQMIAVVETKTAAKLQTVDNYLQGLRLEDILLESYIRKAVEGMFKNLEIEIYDSAKNKNVPTIALGYVAPDLQVPKQKTKSIEKYWQEIESKRKQIKDSNKSADYIAEELDKLNKEAFENAPKLDIDEVALDKETKKIAEDYVYNMQYWVKNWEVKNIIKMRQDLVKMRQEGARIPEIREYFEKRWKVAKDKAQFLATNESHLAASTIKATHYQNMGFTHFKWGRSSSIEKRPLHEEYYGKIFSYSNPPIIDEKLGIRGLPRQIWNCKCVQIPVTNESFIKNAVRINNDRRNIFKKLFNSKQLNNNSWRYRRFGEG